MNRHAPWLASSVLVGSMSIPIVLALLLAIWTSYWGLVLGVLIALLITLLLIMYFLHYRGKKNDWVISIAVILSFMITPEVALRVAGFRFESGIQFGYPRPSHFVNFVADDKLFWKLDRGREDVNSLGFLGSEILVPKPSDVIRIVFLGDSVTNNGYPKYVQYFLNDGMSKPKYEAINFGVSGYSSHQGVIVASD